MFHDDIKNPHSDLELISSSNHDSGRPAVQDREGDLLRFYAKQTGNRIKERDRDAFKRVLVLSDNAIKCGIIQSVLLCPVRVGSFAYCVPAVFQQADDPGSDYVKFLEDKLKKYGPSGMRQETLPGFGADVADITKGRK
jgi:hypothetical protein